MPDCQHCGGRAQLPLCPRCTHELRENLMLLVQRQGTNMVTGETRPQPGLFEELENECWGMSKKGESERRSSEHSKPLPVHLRASLLRDNVVDMIHRWAQHLTIHMGGC